MLEMQAAHDEQKESERLYELEEIKSIDSLEIVKRLNDSILSTEILIDGFQLAGGFTDDIGNVAYAAVLALRNSLECAIAWIEHQDECCEENIILQNEENSEEEL